MRGRRGPVDDRIPNARRPGDPASQACYAHVLHARLQLLLAWFHLPNRYDPPPASIGHVGVRAADCAVPARQHRLRVFDLRVLWNHSTLSISAAEQDFEQRYHLISDSAGGADCRGV